MKHALNRAGLTIGPARTLAVAATLVLAGSLAGCGGGDDEPEAAPSETTSTADFCETYNSLFESFAEGKQPTDAEAVKAIKTWADDLDEVGTPEDIPADAQDGYDLIVATIQKIEDDATQADVQKLTDAFSAAEQKSSDAFGKWATEACPLQTPSGSPSEGSSSSAP